MDRKAAGVCVVRKRFAVFVWLRCEESRRDEVVARLRAHRPVVAAAQQGDLVPVGLLCAHPHPGVDLPPIPDCLNLP